MSFVYVCDGWYGWNAKTSRVTIALSHSNAPNKQHNRALASGLAAAVGGLLVPQPPLPPQDEEGNDDDNDADEDEEEDEQEGQERRDRRRLADLLLHALLLLARPLARSRLALRAHALADATTPTSTRPTGLALPERAALEAQLLLERLVTAWAPGPAAGPAAFSRNPRFTPAVLLALAMNPGSGGPGGADTGTTNAGVAARVLEAAGRAEAALALRVEEAAAVHKAAAASGSSENLEAELAGLLLGLVRTHVLRRGGGEDEDWGARRRMAARVLEAWARLALPPGPFEALVLGGSGEGDKELGGWERHMLTALLVDLLVLHAGTCRG